MTTVQLLLHKYFQERWGNVFFGIRRYFEQICNFIKSSLPSIELDAGGVPMMAQDGIERTLWVGEEEPGARNDLFACLETLCRSSSLLRCFG